MAKQSFDLGKNVRYFVLKIIDANSHSQLDMLTPVDAPIDPLKDLTPAEML
jgi:hypothetical protein